MDSDSNLSSQTCPVCGTYHDIDTKNFGIITCKGMKCVKCDSILAVIEKPKSIFLKLLFIICWFFIYVLLRTTIDGHVGLIRILTSISAVVVFLIIDSKLKHKYITVPYTNKKSLHRMQFANIVFVFLAIFFVILIIVYVDGNKYSCAM